MKEKAKNVRNDPALPYPRYGTGLYFLCNTEFNDYPFCVCTPGMVQVCIFYVKLSSVIICSVFVPQVCTGQYFPCNTYKSVKILSVSVSQVWFMLGFPMEN